MCNSSLKKLLQKNTSNNSSQRHHILLIFLFSGVQSIVVQRRQQLIKSSIQPVNQYRGKCPHYFVTHIPNPKHHYSKALYVRTGRKTLPLSFPLYGFNPNATKISKFQKKENLKSRSIYIRAKNPEQVTISWKSNKQTKKKKGILLSKLFLGN